MIGDVYNNIRFSGFDGHPEEVAAVRNLMGALEIARDKKTGQPFDSNLKVGDRFARSTRRNGLIVRPLGNSVALAPPQICTEGDLAQIDDRIPQSADEVGSLARADQARN